MDAAQEAMSEYQVVDRRDMRSVQLVTLSVLFTCPEEFFSEGDTLNCCSRIDPSSVGESIESPSGKEGVDIEDKTNVAGT